MHLSFPSKHSMSSTQDEAQDASINPSGTIKTSVGIYFTILGIGLIVFECVRRRYRRAYDTRGTEDSAFWTHSTAMLSKKPLGWIWLGFQASDEEILERCGLDTLSFLRFLRMGQKISLLVICMSISLVTFSLNFASNS